MLRTCEAPLDEDIVNKYLTALRVDWGRSRWETSKLSSSYVGSKGWADFHKDLANSIAKKYPEFK